MPTNSRVFLKPFIGGLNTEGSDTDDMVLNTSEELNCTILPEQMRGRRYGFNIEPEGRWIDSGETISAHCVYHWNNVYGDTNFIVVQINKKLYIFNDVYPISAEDPIKVFDLSSFATTDTLTPLDITSVTDTLFIVGRWIYPLVIKYDSVSGDFKDPEKNNPKFRDFNGVDDGLKIDELPSTLSMLHLYNLINQGWDKEIYDPVGGTSKTLLPGPNTEHGLFYETAGSKYPANNMQWFLGKEKSGEYNTTDLLNTYFGNTPAPKGHYILDYIHRSRSYACGFTLSDEPYTALKYSVSNWENMPNGLYDDNKWATSGKAWHMWWGRQGAAGYCIQGDQIRNYFYKYELPADVSENIVQAVIVKIMTKVISWSTSASGGLFFPDFKRSTQPNFLYYHPFKLTLIGIAADGTETELGSGTYQMDLEHNAETEESFTLSTDNNAAYPKYAVKISWPTASTDRFYWYPQYTRFKTAVSATASGELGDIIDGLPSSDTLKGAITDVENFGGRIFYLCGNTVLFSQTLSTDNKNYDKCYQDADPTSEEVSDIIATDGGMIQMLSLGRGKALKSFYRGVLVFGDKEVSGILSNSINLFSAESYDVVKITTAGLAGRYSIVETDSNIFYWSQHGIYIIGIDENNNISSQCISLNSIQNWYMSLDQMCKDNVVGYYDYANNRIYWFYPTTLDTERLDGCLVYDLTFNSFMPQSIDGGNVVRDIYGEYVGTINTYLNKLERTNRNSEDVVIEDNVVYNKNRSDVIGFTQPNYITDCCESTSVNYITPTYRLRAGGNIVKANGAFVTIGTSNDPNYDRKSAGIILVSDGEKFSFGDFNDREFHDWDVSPFESYMVSRPITLGDTYFNKQTPVMQTLFKRTEEHKLRNYVNTTDKANTKYLFKDLIVHTGNGAPKHTADFIVPNEGKFKKVKISIDLTAYDNVRFNYLRLSVSSSNSALQQHIDDLSFGGVDVWNVDGGRKYNFELLCPDELKDETRHEFRVIASIHPYTTIDPSNIKVNGQLVLDRTEATDATIIGWEEVTETGSVGFGSLQHPTPDNYYYESETVDIPASYVQHITANFKNYPSSVYSVDYRFKNWGNVFYAYINVGNTPGIDYYPDTGELTNCFGFSVYPDIGSLYFTPPADINDEMVYAITYLKPVYKMVGSIVETDYSLASRYVDDVYRTSDIPLKYEIDHIETEVEPHWRSGHEPADWYCKLYMYDYGFKPVSQANNKAVFQIYNNKYDHTFTNFFATDWLLEEDDEHPNPYKPESYNLKYTLYYKPVATRETIVPAQYTTPSGVIIRMRWGWSVDPLSNRWDMMQNGYRPQKDFMHDDYVESRMHIRGRGKAFQIEVRNDSNKDFRLTGLNIITRSPQ